MVNLASPDLTQHPPRSVRVRLGGYAHLPRLLDKARAFAAGKQGEYHYNCPMDKHFFAFTGIDSEAMLTAVKASKSDTEILAWVATHTKRLPYEIAQWSSWLEAHGPKSVGGHVWLSETVKKAGPDREDVMSFSDLLDLDDYASYGGKG
jgi:hypothetical protein